MGRGSLSSELPGMQKSVLVLFKKPLQNLCDGVSGVWTMRTTRRDPLVMASSQEPLVASLLLVAMPFAPSSVLARDGQSSSFVTNA